MESGAEVRVPYNPFATLRNKKKLHFICNRPKEYNCRLGWLYITFETLVSIPQTWLCVNKLSTYRPTHQFSLLKKSRVWIGFCTVTDRWSFLFYLTDVNECNTGVHSCEHKCQNTPGSYGCSCFYGYRQRADMQTCEGRLCNTNTTLDQIQLEDGCFQGLSPIARPQNSVIDQ